MAQNSNRQSARLKYYDYSRVGAYFVTINAANRTCLFGNIVEGKMRLNAAGEIARECWAAIPDHFPQVHLDEFVIMPNHIHGIIVITTRDWVVSNDSTDFRNVLPLQVTQQFQQTPTAFRSPSRTLGSMVRGFKIGVTKWIRSNTDTHNVWQRSYYDHVIRDEYSMESIRNYIASNPSNWPLDPENSASENGNAEELTDADSK